MPWRERFARFFCGRYGNDTLNRFLFGCTLVTLLLSSALRNFLVPRTVLAALSCVTVAWYFYRSMSRAVVRRQAENRAFLRVFSPIRDGVVLQFRRVRDCRSFVYRKCPQCHAVLRLPRRAGNHTVRCPRCSRTWETRVRGNARPSK